jgi:hypothetical protein
MNPFFSPNFQIAPGAHPSPFSEKGKNMWNHTTALHLCLKIMLQGDHIHGKGPHLNTLERFYIHKEASLNNHLNDDHTVIPSRFFDTILKMQHLPPTSPPPNHSRNS